jgi:hypothetical protein
VYLRRGNAALPRFEDIGWHDYKFSEGLAAVKLGDKWGYIDRRGRVVVSPRFDSANNFSEGLAVVEVNKKKGFIDRRGCWVIPPRFALADRFSEGLASVNVGYRYGMNDEDPNRRDGKWGYVDRSGRFRVPAKYDWAGTFSEGLAVVRSGGAHGFIDRTGAVRIELKYEDAGEFSEGLAGVRLNYKWGYIDRSGRMVIEPGFSAASRFSGGLAWVNGGDEYINRVGEVVGKRRPDEQGDEGERRVCEPKIKPPPPSLAALARRREQIHQLIFNGQYQHDGAGELGEIGDMTSVPALLRVLKDNPGWLLANGRRAYICTYSHAVAALTKITGHEAHAYEDWVAWWDEYQKTHPTK